MGGRGGFGNASEKGNRRYSVAASLLAEIRPDLGDEHFHVLDVGFHDIRVGHRRQSTGWLAAAVASTFAA